MKRIVFITAVLAMISYSGTGAGDRVTEEEFKDDDDILVDNLLCKGNRLEVILGTSLRNRMAGDMEKYGRTVNIETPTSTNWLPQGEKDLKPSGLMGPVSVIMYK